MLSMLANVNQNLHVCYSVMFTSSSSSYDSGRGHTTWSLSAKKTLARLFLEERVLNLEVLLHIFAEKKESNKRKRSLNLLRSRGVEHDEDERCREEKLGLGKHLPSQLPSPAY